MIDIETPRLRIRNFHPGDAADLRELVVQKQGSEYAAYDEQWPTGEAQIAGIAAWFAQEDQYAAVCLKDTGKLIGYIGLSRSGAGIYDLGYAFNFDYHGHGYATESCRAMVDYAFRDLQASTVAAGTAAANGPSCRLLARLGMQKTGELTASFTQNPDGTPFEFLGYAFTLTREAWEQGKAQA